MNARAGFGLTETLTVKKTPEHQYELMFEVWLVWKAKSLIILEKIKHVMKTLL